MSDRQPLRDMIIVTKEEQAKTTASGLYIAHAEDKIVEGTVLAVGSGRIASNGAIVPLEVKVGDKVVFNKNFAVEVTKDGATVLVIREEQLLFKI